ncbi:MAG: hypothetical protein Q9217_001428 [Psora testacea]
MIAIQKHYDVIIIGAGVHGLCAAHTFLLIDPSLALLIIDSKSSVGGVWAQEQLYPGLRANNLQGYFEFSDFPILDAGLDHFGVRKRGLLSGEALHAYVYEYAKHFDLLRRTRLNTKVVHATNNDTDATNAWALELTHVEGTAEKAERLITCAKLILATGQTSQPWLPSFPGLEACRIPVIHSTYLGKQGQTLVSDLSVAHVTIVGGSKSAHDAVYMFAMAGKRVTWLTRRTGRGAMPMANSYTHVGPWKVWLEGLLMNRSLSWFGACPWSDGDGFGWTRWLLHGTTVGRRLVSGYFASMLASTLDQSGILQDEKTKVLVPDQSLMWYGTQAGILTYDTDIYRLVQEGRIQVIREDIAHLDEDAIVLQNGQNFKTDALICATGYDYGPSFPLEPAGKRLRWGVPVTPSQDDIFPALDAEADIELFDRFPMLKTSPRSTERQPGLTPWRLWRFIAPPSQVCSGLRSIAFLSAITSYQTTTKCELTSLWAYAYLYDALSIKPATEADVMYEAALWSRFGKWRCPMGMQGKIADFFHDSMPYYDLLLRDLGLRSWRKGWGLLGEVFSRWYEVKDYRGIVDEWIAARQDLKVQVDKKLA